MARIRTIKPGFFRSEDVAALPLRARLLWVGLWTQCDDQGRTKDNPKLIKADVWPLDPVTLADIEEDLITLAAHGRIVRYEVDGRRYLEVVNWGDHQSINRPTPSKLPPPPNGSYPQVSTHGRLSEDSHQEGKGKEGKGGDARARASRSAGNVPDADSKPPPRTCKIHPDGTTERCGPCKSARQRHERWQADRETAKAEADRHARDSPRCENCGNPTGSAYHRRVCGRKDSP
jgi:hypothetical protein